MDINIVTGIVVVGIVALAVETIRVRQLLEKILDTLQRQKVS